MVSGPYRDLDPIRGVAIGVAGGFFAWIGIFASLRWLRDLLTGVGL